MIRLSTVAAYIQCACTETIDILIEFPWTTWLVALVYSLIIALLSGNACVDDHWLHVVLNVASVVGYAYMALRIIAFHALVQAEADPERVWPAGWFDRFITFWLGPGFLGFHPFSHYPSCKLFFAVQQSWVFFHLQRIAFAISNVNGSLYRSDKPHAGIIMDIILTSGGLIIAAIVIWPLFVEICVHTPYGGSGIGTREHHFCTVLKRMSAAADHKKAAPSAVSTTSAEVQVEVKSTA